MESLPPLSALRPALRWKAWIAAARLPFYLMSLLTFSAGAQAGSAGMPWNWPAWAVGMSAMLLIEFISVLTNELEDEPSDRVNANAGPFNGGSRVLASGRLFREDLLDGRRLALGVLAALTAGWLAISQSWEGVGLVAAGLVLGMGYSAAPLRLSYRTLGEVNVAFVHSFLVIGAGYWTQQKAWDASLLKISGPVFFAVLPSIILSGFPDAEADRSVGKRTLVVRLGRRSAAILALCATILAPVTLLVFRQGGALPSWLLIGGTIHAAALALWTMRAAARQLPSREMNGLIGFSLAFLLWFIVAVTFI